MSEEPIPLNVTIENFLSAKEKKELSQRTLNKLNKDWSIKQKECLDLAINLEKCQSDFEEQKFILEKQIESLQKELEEEGKYKASLKDDVKELNLKCNQQEGQLKGYEEKIETLHKQLNSCKAEQEIKSADVISLAARLDETTKLSEELQQHKTILEVKLAETQTEKYKALGKAEEYETLHFQYQFQERKYKQETCMLTNELSSIQNQLKEIKDEKSTMQVEHRALILSLRSEVNNANLERKIFSEEKESLQKRLDEKVKKCEDLLKSFNELQSSESRLEETFRQELMAQKKMTTLFEASSEDQKQRAEDLEKALEELRQLLQEASEQYGVLEMAKKKAEEEAQIALTKNGQIIKDLQDELEKVNELLKGSIKKDDMMAENFPEAAAIRQLMSKGLTLSQLYTECLDLTSKLYKSKDENKELRNSIDRIYEELKVRDPQIRKQKDDFERAVDTISALQSQIEDSFSDFDKQKIECEEANRQSGFLTRENDRLNQQVKDLSKQVAVLITQVEAARLGLEIPDMDDWVSGKTTGMNANKFIDSRLLTFRDAKELQEQNTKLLSALRDVSSQMEANGDEQKTYSNLKDELSHAKKELSDIKYNREKLESRIESITSQRDLYRKMVNQQTPMTNGESFSSPRRDDSFLARKELEKMQKQLENANKELEVYKKNIEEDQQTKSFMDKSEEDRLKAALDTTKNENIRLLSHAEYNEERLKTLQNNCEAYQRQLNVLQEKNDELLKESSTYKTLMENFQQSSSMYGKQLGTAEMQVNNLKEERTMLKQSEARLYRECEILQQNQSKMTSLMQDMQSIKNSFDRSNEDRRAITENKIAELNEQCFRLKVKLESNTDIKEANARIAVLEEKFSVCQNELEVLQKELVESEKQIRELKFKESQYLRPSITSPVISRTTGSLQTTPSRGSNGQSSQSLRDLQLQLAEEQSKNTMLSGKLEQALQNVEDMRKLVEEQEEQLMSRITENKSLNEEHEKVQKLFETATNDVEDLNTKLIAARESEIALRDMTNQQLMKMTEDLEERENELEEAQKQVEEWKIAEAKCKDQINEQINLANKMQDNYQEEVMLHAADIEAIASLKQNLCSYESQLEELKRSKLKAEEQLQEVTAGYEQQENQLKSNNEALKKRETELEEANQNLLEQLTTLSEKIDVIKAKVNAEGTGTASFSDDYARSSEQLREAIKYLRQLSETNIEKVHVAQSEAQRLEAQKKALEVRLENSEKLLIEERKKKQNVSAVADGVDASSKANTTELLFNSNKLLRDENNKLTVEIKAKNTTVQSLQAQIGPIQETNRDIKNQNDSLVIDKKCLEDEKIMLQNRIQELVEKINRSKPEDMIELQRQLLEVQKELQMKKNENNRLKTMMTNLSKTQQSMTQLKNQAQLKLQNKEEEFKKAMDESKKANQDKIRLHQQLVSCMDRLKTVEKQMEQLKENLTKQAAEDKKQLKKEVDSKNEMDVKITALEKKNQQLTSIAIKYKNAAKLRSETAEKATNTTEDIVAQNREKELEEKNTSLIQQLENLKKEIGILRECIARIELEKKTVAVKSTNEQGSSNSGTLQDTERENYVHQIEELNKKLVMQKQIIENHQKQSSVSLKSSSSSIIIEKQSSDTPTANIKPMAAPVPAASSPRTPAASQGGTSSRTIPTASIRPMAPSLGGSIGVVQPMESHLSGDGAVSSTVTLPQATVTPTPVAPTTSFASALTATVTPTLLQPQTTSSSHEGTPSTSGAADDFISQAIAIAQMDSQPSGGSKRKFETDEEDVEEENKRTRVIVEEEEAVEDQEEALDEAPQEEEMGQPSSSSNQNNEIYIVSSDEEGDASNQGSSSSSSPPSGSVAVVESGEREAEGMESQASSSLLQPPTIRPPVHQEAASSSSRQNLAPFHQLPQFDEASEDRTVPSTPTLFAPRTCEGSATDGVSSPQVPSQGFEFGQQQGSQLASRSGEGQISLAEAENIEDTNMDFGQLENVGVQQPILASQSEVVLEENISSSAGESSGGVDMSNEENEAELVTPIIQLERDNLEEEEEDEQVVSSQETDNFVEEIDDEEDEDDSVEEHQANLTPERPQRSGTQSPGRRLNITPIVWQQHESQQPPVRGRGVRRGFPTQGVAQNQSFVQTRGQRARRSRPGGKS